MCHIVYLYFIFHVIFLCTFGHSDNFLQGETPERLIGSGERRARVRRARRAWAPRARPDDAVARRAFPSTGAVRAIEFVDDDDDDGRVGDVADSRIRRIRARRRATGRARGGGEGRRDG